MPRFKRTCSNPFHEKWSKREEEKTISLRARALVAIANVFEKYIEEELGKKSVDVNIV
jgi:alkylhydroperoxidase/carboxymuconolactone decarboxylase family protein YurZ